MPRSHPLRPRHTTLCLGLMATVLAAAPPALAAEQPRVAAALQRQVDAGRLEEPVLDQLRTRGSVEAILSVKSAGILRQELADAPAGPDRVRAVVDGLKDRYADAKGDALQGTGGEAQVEREFRALPTSVVRFESEEALLTTLRDPKVASVRADAVLERSTVESLPLIRQPEASAAGHRGDGTYTAVLDTGVDYTHEAFGCSAQGQGASCRVEQAWDAAPDDGLLDDDGHGTNVAAIAAAVAPGTRILAVDVFDGDSARDQDTFAGINWAIEQRRRGRNIRAINLSLGSESFHTQACQSAYTALFAEARAVGIAPVVAAGNSGHLGYGVESPACAAGAISVGAVYDRDRTDTQTWGPAGRQCSDASPRADQITCFSQSGPTLSLLAPGAMITAAGVRMGGTSQAAPHVAGAVAVLAAAKPAAGVAEIEDALVNSGPTVRDPRGREVRRLDLPAALERLLGQPAKPADTEKPAMTQAPAARVADPLGDTTVPVDISWAGRDNVGVERYVAWLSTDGGAFARVSLDTAAATSKRLDLEPGHAYQLAVSAVDATGNASDYAYGPRFTLDAHQETYDPIEFDTAWTQYDYARPFGGGLKYAETAGATAGLTFTGREIAWVAPIGADRGQSNVYLDGRLVGTVDQGGSNTTTSHRRVVFSRRFATPETHTLTIRSLGTPGRERVDVDAFVVLR